MLVSPIPRGLRAPGNLLSFFSAARIGALLLSFFSLGTLTACSPEPASPSSAAGELVAIRTSDGLSLGATLYAAEPGAPGLVLVHALGSNRQTWDRFAQQANREGYAVIAFDMRGHGKNNGSYRSFTTQDWLDVLTDIDAARAFLLNKGADNENTAVVGASIGANLALRYAVDNPDIPAVVMISPGLDYRGVTTSDQLPRLGQRPVLLMTSIGDAYSASSSTALKKLAPGLCELREYPGTAHGTDLLDATPTATDQIFVWLKPIIGPGA